MSRELEVLAALEAEKHRPDEKRGGCECGFCAWSIEHAVIMSVRAALAAVSAVPEEPNKEQETT